MYRNKKQNSALHALIGELNIEPEQKEELVYQYTNGRTTSSSKMFINECQKLIDHLNSIKKTVPKKPDPANIMRRKILAICHELQWTVDGKVDFARLNTFLVEKGHLHKQSLNDYAASELPTLITQFEQLQKSFYAKR